MRSSQGGKALLAIAWVRGAVQHKLANVTKIATVGGSFLPMLIGTVDSQIGAAGRPELRWQTLSRLGTQFDRHDRHHYYRDLVATQPLAVPLRSAQCLLASMPVQV